MTTQLPKLSELTNDEKRILIAEKCGWTLVQYRASVLSQPWLSGMNPNPHVIDTVVELDGTHRKPTEQDYGFETLPDYLNDLNACHDMENSMTADDFYNYCSIDLPKVCDYSAAVHAIARQRCDAFLLTMGLAVL